ncbi:MAG: hypothetical protein LBC39_01400 [Methanobrevibacter sp.]|jgi:hypothetical protein|nr:hypothetical protein [Candidatus Methanovirga aequatorialis]
MKSQNLKRFFVMAIAIFCFVAVVGSISASNPELDMNDARDIAIYNVDIFIGSEGVVVQDGAYCNDTKNYVFPVVDMRVHKIVGNVYVDGENGNCTSDFLTRDEARRQIYDYIKDHFPKEGYGVVPQTPIYMSNVHYGEYGFRVPVFNFNNNRSFYLYIVEDGTITD